MSVPYYGDFAEDDTVYIPFNTFSSDDPSASVTITDLVNTDIHIHKDGAVAQRNNAAGITMSVNFDGITGNHIVAIDTSDDTVAGFWVTGSDYQVRMEGTTIDSATVNAWIGSFSIERAGGALALLKLIQAAVITNAAGADVAADIIAVKAETAVINAFWNVFILAAGTIGAVGNDTTHLHLTGLTYGNDELNDYIIVIYDNSEAEYHSVWITDWVLATALATVETMAFTPEDSVDPYWIFALKKHPDITTILNNIAAGVDIVKIHGTAITETTGGRIAGNFSTFWDNADAATAEVVDNVGGASGGGSNLVLPAGYVGDFKDDDTVSFNWDTIDRSGAAKAPSTAGTIKVYKDTGTTEVQAPTGITDTRAFSGTTGNHQCVIDLSASTSYVKGSNYSVVLEGAVVDTKTVNVTIATFSIEKRYQGREFEKEG